MPTSSPCWSMPPRASTRTSSASSEKLAGDRRAPMVLVLNKIDRVEDKTQLLELAAELNERVPFERHLHDLRAQRRRRRRLKAYLASAVPPRALALPGGRDLGRAAAAAGLRDHAREDLRAAARRAALRTTVETTAWQELKNGSCASSRRSSSSATARRASCSARAAHDQAHVDGVARRS